MSTTNTNSPENAEEIASPQNAAEGTSPQNAAAATPLVPLTATNKKASRLSKKEKQEEANRKEKAQEELILFLRKEIGRLEGELEFHKEVEIGKYSHRMMELYNYAEGLQQELLEQQAAHVEEVDVRITNLLAQIVKHKEKYEEAAAEVVRLVGQISREEELLPFVAGGLQRALLEEAGRIFYAKYRDNPDAVAVFDWMDRLKLLGSKRSIKEFKRRTGLEPGDISELYSKYVTETLPWDAKQTANFFARERFEELNNRVHRLNVKKVEAVEIAFKAFLTEPGEVGKNLIKILRAISGDEVKEFWAGIDAAGETGYLSPSESFQAKVDTISAELQALELQGSAMVPDLADLEDSAKVAVDAWVLGTYW
ncbi:hypothetical protein BJ508DRAFT_314417 [Ascobolus immersus RN42]|uniref:Uncharacterized protein n=1 Tax=Ascobolus immersus RN42 TaxID=1160509 RepID=A0A3N4HF71_ASCIM|nr:hypothetical protein BJ508DRAFT_314417 [Ascobolus immersus RN42]